MISKIGVENNLSYSNIKNNKQDSKASPSFKGSALDAVLLAMQACERNPMLNVTLIDMLSAILPRTVIESFTNWFAGFEALRRESSGLIVNCLIPGFITLGVAKVLNKSIMPKNIDMSTCWADSNLVDHASEIYKKSTSKDKVKDVLKDILENIEGFDGDKKVLYKTELSEQALEEYAAKLKELSVKDISRKDFKKNIAKISDEIASKTHVFENIRIKNSKNVKASDLESLLNDTVKFFKEYQKTGKRLDINEYTNLSKKLIKSKSLIGLGIVLPLAASMQFINRKITEKISGVKGAPIYKDFGKENKENSSNKDDTKAKEGLLRQKIISVASMIGVGMLSMMKKPSFNMLEFKGRFPTMDQARIISTTTFASRMLVAEDKNELVETTYRDIATFLSLYFLGDYAAKATATIVQKKKGIVLLNDTNPLEKNAGKLKKAWHWFKDVHIKSSKEVTSKTAKELADKNLKPNANELKKIQKELRTATNWRSGCQFANLGVSLILLGLIIPIVTRKNTEKKHTKELNKAQCEVSSGNNTTLKLSA